MSPTERPCGYQLAPVLATSVVHRRIVEKLADDKS